MMCVLLQFGGFMSYFKIPKEWTETDCQTSITKLLTEGQKRFDKEDYEKSSYYYYGRNYAVRSVFPSYYDHLILRNKTLFLT